MKKIIVFLLMAMFLVTPVMAGWEEEANIGNVKYTIEKYATKPVLDGKLDGEGSYTKIPVTPGDISYAWDDAATDSEANARATTFEVYATYDDKNLYVFVRGDAKFYFNDMPDGDGNSWQYSCLQVSVSAGDDAGEDRLEYGIWRNSADSSLGSVVWAQHALSKAEFTPAANDNYAVILEGGSLYYETVIPVNTFLNKDTVAQSDIIGFNIVVASRDEANDPGYIHTQFSSGCTGNGKTAENFARLTLGGQMAAPAPAAPAEEPAAPEADATPAPAPVTAPAPVAAPQTGDSTFVFAGLAIIALAAAAIIRKKVSVK